MTHYYDDHVYTPAQARHANAVVLRLIQERRFFLHNPNERPGHDTQDYTLHPEVFQEVIDLDTQSRNLYITARREATAKITSGEKGLGINRADLSNNRQLVVCNRYGGGFNICRVYPLTVFAAMAPINIEQLVSEHLALFMGGRPSDDITPNTMRKHQGQADLVARLIWSEFEQLELSDPQNRRCVVLLESKLSCSGSDNNDDFAESRVTDMQSTPFALGYLFWKFSQTTRIVRHNHVVFGTSRKSHVNVQHWSDTSSSRGIPSIHYSANTGYDCPVIFVTAL